MKNSNFYFFTILMAIRILNPLESPGRNNPKYKIGSYYGSRYLCNMQYE